MTKRNIYVNPFDDAIVSEPRRVNHSISGLNDKSLEMIIQRFETLTLGQVPRKSQITHAQFIVSPQPGYGKSHMIGRLFNRLNRRAVMVYVKPFEDAATCWKSILLNLVQELAFPENIQVESCSDLEPSQLESFAHGVLMNLTAEAVEVGVISDRKDHIIHNLRTISISEFRKNKSLVKWVRLHMNELVKLLTMQLSRHGVIPYANPVSWLTVLFTLAYNFDQFELRIACNDWLQGGSIDMEEAKAIGIKLKDIPHYEMSGNEINQLCKYRIQDFCKLAGFFKPILFCFDQTENYGKDIQLSKAFGSVIQALRDECLNQMTVITVNQDAWDRSIKCWWEDAFLQRLSPPIELEGLSCHQAKELVQWRFDEWRCESEVIENFFKDHWVEKQFETISQCGVRAFLNKASLQYQDSIGKKTPPKPISDYYSKALEDVKSKPKRLVYDPNTLIWIVKEAAAGFPDISVESYSSPKGYFLLQWKTKDSSIYFGFESGSHFKRWEAIAREASIHWKADPKSKAVFFRTPELPDIPRSTWKIAPEIESAKQQYLHLLCIQKHDLEKLYAAHDLYIDAAEGNIPYQRIEVLTFIREELRGFWEMILSPLSTKTVEQPPRIPPVVIDPKLIENIRKIVSVHKLLSVMDCIQYLPEPVSEEQFHIARGQIPEIKVHTSPGMTVLQWQSKLSQ